MGRNTGYMPDDATVRTWRERYKTETLEAIGRSSQLVWFGITSNDQGVEA